MEQKTEFVLDMLTTDSVSVLQKRFFVVNGQSYFMGNIRNAYMNSTAGRQAVSAVLPNEYYEAVMAVWGTAPTILDPQI